MVFYKIEYSLKGGIIGGLISDIIGKRSVVIVALLTLAIPSLYGFSGNLKYFI